MKFIPYEKMSKKAQKEINNRHRNSMGEHNHKNSVVPSGKIYRRHEKHRKAYA
jgi:hypothetical protein